MKVTIATLVKKKKVTKSFLMIAREKKLSILYKMQVKLCKEMNTIEDYSIES